MTIAWVIGRGGLLGSALERELAMRGSRCFRPDRSFTWRDAASVQDEMVRQTARFASQARAGEPWEVCWAAGVGTMGSRDEALATETNAFGSLLTALESSPALSPANGRIVLASSAGAIYAGSTDPVIDERTIDRPTTPYARAKLQQERLIREHAARSGTATLISRISTLYGVGQASEKPQGLLTHISRCVIQNRPVQIFVPLDTIRDYIGAADAAAMSIDALGAACPGRTMMKIVASERPATISEILSIFKRLARRPPRVVTSGASVSSVYTRRIQFRSVVAPLRSRQPLTLMIGISQVLAAERMRYVSRGQGSGR